MKMKWHVASRWKCLERNRSSGDTDLYTNGQLNGKPDVKPDGKPDGRCHDGLVQWLGTRIH